MASPARGDWALMKRVGRYLLGAPRAVQEFPWQGLQGQLDTYVDSDWAGCKTSCRSTSGGAAKIGWHLIKSWSTTQATVAMSSAEAELYALTKGAANSLGFMAMAADLGIALDATVHSDASAALGIVQRRGLGKLRHIRVQYLWVQDRLRRGDFQVRKVPGKQNPADLLTKHLPAQEIQSHMESLGFVTSASRAALTPQLSSLGARAARKTQEDAWKIEGYGVIREHRRPRTTLFTPLRVAGAPPGKALTSTRVTRGEHLDDGESFVRTDNWTTRGTAHLCLSRRWVGSTTFLMKTSSCEFLEPSGNLSLLRTAFCFGGCAGQLRRKSPSVGGSEAMVSDNTTQHNTIQYNAADATKTMQYSTIHWAASAALYCIVLFCSVLYCIVL